MIARWLKRIGLTLVVLVIVVVGAVAAALLLVDTEALKSRIEGRVLAETGRELNIEGPLEISVFPWVGFELGPTRLANAPGFGERDFVALNHAELRVRVLPLLQREIVLDTVVLHGARVNAARNAQGRTNWADLLERQGAAGEEEETARPESPPAESPAAPAANEGPALQFRVEGVDLRDARLSWRDAQNNRELVFDDLDLSTGALALDRPADIHLTGTLRADNALVVAVETRARVQYDLATQVGTVQGLTIDLAAQGPGLPPGTSASLGADLQFDLADGTATVDPLTLTAMDTLTGEGATHVRFGDGTPSFSGNFAIAPFSPAELIEAAHGTLPERADSSTLQHADLALSFRGTNEEITLEPLEVGLDDTAISARVHARFAQMPRVELGMNVNAIDLDRYLPPEGEGEDSNESQSGGGPDETSDAEPSDPIANLPTEALQGLGAHARLDVGQLSWRELTMDDVRLEANLGDGVLDLTRADLGVAGGRVSATGQFDARDAENPAAQVNAELAGLQSEPLLAAFLDNPLISGRLNAQAQLSAAGPNLDAWTRSLNGNLATIFHDGAIRGLNVPQRLRMAAARLRGDELAQASESRATDFSSLSLSAAIEEGVARSDDLDLRAPLVRASGEGWVNLPERTLDYTARVLVTGTLEGQGGETGPDLRGLEVPLRLSGPLNSPEIELAIAEGLRDRVEQEVEQESEEAEQRAREEIEEETEKARDRIEEELREGLDGLFE